jgi:hypothetical protein
VKITGKAIDELIAIYKEEFGEEIDRQEATEIAHRLLALYRMLGRKPPNEDTVTPNPTQHDDDRPRLGFRT